MRFRLVTFLDVFLTILIVFGVLIYLIANHQGMADRRARDEQAAQAQVDAYVRSVTKTGGPASEIERAKALLDSGAINQAEFEQIKSQALAGERGGAAPAGTGV